MDNKHIIIIDTKKNKNKIKYFLINKANRKLLDIIENYTKTHKPYKTVTECKMAIGGTGGAKG